MIEQIDHVNLVVRDMEAMTNFYRDVLGFRVTKSVSISGAWIDAVVGLTDVLADVAYLEPPTGPRVELIYYQQPASTQLHDQSFANTIGLRHLAFRVSDIDETVIRLKLSGVGLNGSITSVPLSQVQYAGGAQKRLVYFHDPEGNLLELCEYKS